MPIGGTLARVVKVRLAHGWGARTSVDASGGTACSVVAPEGHRTVTFLGGVSLGYPKKHSGGDWL